MRDLWVGDTIKVIGSPDPEKPGLPGVDVDWPLPKDPDQAVAATLGVMSEVARDGAKSPTIRIVSEIVCDLIKLRGYGTYAKTLYHFLAERCKFQADPNGVEHLRHPAVLATRILRSPHNVLRIDCDDLATLAASLLLVVDYPPVFVVMSPLPTGPYRHVFAGVAYGRGDRLSPCPHDLFMAIDPQETCHFGQRVPAGRMEVVYA